SWTRLASSLDDEPENPELLPATGSGDSQPGSSGAAAEAGVDPQASQPSIEAIVEVLTEPAYEMELRAWTASQMARIYPAEAAELVSTTLKSDDPKVMIAIIEGVTLDDADGRVRTALNRLRGHKNARVAAAVRKKLNSSD
ncbi:MAG: hypothetical protein JRG94_14465, partial [Deltaproteobacteria bacterium]|nr:hypothetical protein [Deltaproteobacteria bacterium]